VQRRKSNGEPVPVRGFVRPAREKSGVIVSFYVVGSEPFNRAAFNLCGSLSVITYAGQPVASRNGAASA